MRILNEGGTLRVTGIKELGVANANQVRDEVRAAFTPGSTSLEFDLAETTFIDSCGLGALIALHKTASQHKGVVRLLNPQPSVAQILRLTRMHQIFEIVQTT